MSTSTYDLMQRRHRQACGAFSWIGQSFATCDDCARPFWEHTHRYALGGECQPGRYVLKVITREHADKVRAKWENA